MALETRFDPVKDETYWIITCDACGNERPRDEWPFMIAQRALAAGWRRIETSNTEKFYCPECVAHLVEGREARAHNIIKALDRELDQAGIGVGEGGLLNRVMLLATERDCLKDLVERCNERLGMTVDILLALTDSEAGDPYSMVVDLANEWLDQADAEHEYAMKLAVARKKCDSLVHRSATKQALAHELLCTIADCRRENK